MKAILKGGVVRYFSGSDVKEIVVSVMDDVIVIVLLNGEVLLATSINVEKK